MEVLDTMEALDLLIASDELLLTELSEYIQNDLLVNGFAWLEKNSIIVWEKIYKYESCVKLQDYCIKLICKDPIKYLFASTEFLSMDEKTLSEFLKLDGLEIEEIELWNNILKWGLAQNPYLLLHDNNNNDKDARLSRVLHQRSFYAIRFNGNNYGPCFGDKDLCMKGCFNESGSCSAQKDDYCTSITDCKVFSIDEYEFDYILGSENEV
ncbi:10629_t:CDS:2 [Entrophospora sp. SA101]|nr:10629_t:CDS:2 [Entrophospora sp. SA101]